MSCFDEELPSCSTVRFPRARKTHTCCGCGETIRKGDRYRNESGIWDGRAERYKYCARCHALISAVLAQPGNEGFVHGFMCDHSWEEIFESDPPPEVATLAFMTPDEAQSALDRTRDKGAG